MEKFSIVVPIRNEHKLAKRTLPTYIALNPDELIIVMDEPAPRETLYKVVDIVTECKFRDRTQLLFVPKGEGWNYQMAKVRRTGFIAAKNDVVFTGDIDCVVNDNCKKAINAVGKNNVAMASVTKFHRPNSLLNVYRLMGHGFIKLYVHKLLGAGRFGAFPFSGQYALYKPYWLDTPEEIEDARKMFSVKQKMREGKMEVNEYGLSSMGEDIHMLEFMRKKYKTLYFSDIGAFVLSDPYDNSPVIQFWKGMFFASKGRGLSVVLARSFLKAQPQYLLGYVYGRRMLQEESGTRLLRGFGLD